MLLPLKETVQKLYIKAANFRKFVISVPRVHSTLCTEVLSCLWIRGFPKIQQLASVVLKFPGKFAVLCTRKLTPASSHLKHLSKYGIGKAFVVEAHLQGRIVTIHPLHVGHFVHVSVEDRNPKPSNPFVVTLEPHCDLLDDKAYPDVGR